MNLVKRCARTHRRGMTLIELLVVVGIIVCLVTILLPSLTRAQELTRMVTCQNQLRGWGIAFSIYSADNEGYLPHCDGLDRDNGSPDYFGWVDLLPPLIGRRPWRDHPLGERPGLGTFFQCPAAHLAPDNLYKYYPRVNGFFSYAMNSCLELDENCWRAPGDNGVALPSFLQTDLVAEPGQVILLFDQLLDPRKGYDAKKKYRSAGKYCGSYPKSFSARHSRVPGKLGGSILYCDGHVEWTDSVWKDNWSDDQEVPPRDDPNWFPYPPS